MKIVYIGGAKAVPLEFLGKEYYLLYNGNAMFQLQEEYGTDFFNDIATNKQKAFRVTAVLSEQGELARRFNGMDNRDYLTEEMIGLLAAPADHMNIIDSCLGAITVGLGREIENGDEEIDLGLVELQKKSGKAERST